MKGRESHDLRFDTVKQLPPERQAKTCRSGGFFAFDGPLLQENYFYDIILRKLKTGSCRTNFVSLAVGAQFYCARKTLRYHKAFREEQSSSPTMHLTNAI